MGSHIATLLIRMFLMYFPDFILKGKVYKAVPPLFGLTQGNKITYFTDNNDVAKYTHQQFAKKYQLSDKDTGKNLTNSEVIKLFTLNMDYTRLLQIAADVTAVSPKLLEDVLIQIADDIEFSTRKAKYFAASKALFSMSAVDNATITGAITDSINFTLKKLNLNALKKRIESKYRFMHTEIVNGTIMISGLAFDKVQNIAINGKFIANCYEVIKLIAKNERLYFNVNGEVKSLYEVMGLVDGLLPNLKRYKGLGEQNPKELYDSTMCIDNRILIQYTMESAKEEIETVRIIDNDRSAILRGLNITRQDIE